MEIILAIIAACNIHSGSDRYDSIMKLQRECQAKLLKCTTEEVDPVSHYALRKCLLTIDNKVGY